MTQCVTCASGYYQFSASCLLTCPRGTYADASANVCQPCVSPAQCESCTGAGNGSCTSCITPYVLAGGSCVLVCPVSQYADTVTRTCVALCPVNLYVDPSTGACVDASSCSAGRFAHAASGACVSACLGAEYGDVVTKTCTTTCPAGLFGDPMSRTCVTTCPTDVTVVPTPSLLYGDPVGRVCVLTCPDGRYGDAWTRLCMPCAPSCGTCATASPETCTSCSAALHRQLMATRCGCEAG
jgi:hypothetical protein